MFKLRFKFWEQKNNSRDISPIKKKDIDGIPELCIEMCAGDMVKPGSIKQSGRGYLPTDKPSPRITFRVILLHADKWEAPLQILKPSLTVLRTYSQ